ncbi:MAG: ATPase F0F1 [Candidatus Omnitrophica bacterium]|nr:ATPase F0F1 [Candidatus Omnitrophota bacterium]
MAEHRKDSSHYRRSLGERIVRKQIRRQRARGKKDGVLLGLGMFGLVGWSVMIPTLIFLFLGIWIDTRWPSRISWTLTLLLFGVSLGCVNAWYWISKEREIIEEERHRDER